MKREGEPPRTPEIRPLPIRGQVRIADVRREVPASANRPRGLSLPRHRWIAPRDEGDA